MGAFEDGSSFITGVLAKLPAELRGQVQEALTKPEAKDAVIAIGDGVLARSDYSKHMDALKTKEGDLQTRFSELNNWYDVNKGALEDYKVIKPKYDVLAKGATPPRSDDDPPPPREPVDIEKTVREVIEQEGRGYVEVSAFLASTGVRHYAMFNEPIDLQELTSNPKLGKPVVGQPGRVFSLLDAYTEKYGDRVAQKSKEAEDKRINDEVDKRVAEKLKGQVTQPFPLRGEAPSVLDVLTTKDGPAQHTLDSAVAEYERLQGART